MTGKVVPRHSQKAERSVLLSDQNSIRGWDQLSPKKCRGMSLAESGSAFRLIVRAGEGETDGSGCSGGAGGETRGAEG